MTPGIRSFRPCRTKRNRIPYFAFSDLFSCKQINIIENVQENAAQEYRREESYMFEYRVELYAVRKAEDEMNRMAHEEWRVISVCPNQAGGFGIIVTYERAK